MCTALIMVMLGLLDGEKVMQIMPAPSYGEALRMSKEFDEPAMAQFLMSQGVVNVEVIDVIKTKPFPCSIGPDNKPKEAANDQ